ncbi:CBM35 domain-containing protein [Streptomyces sp. TG1A-8]|uniref:CBM35 domain-containing protein n=1 Tax=Streptomyces sp. TG1A-8 TaxID=3051385 RepID=UPI003464E01A
MDNVVRRARRMPEADLLGFMGAPEPIGRGGTRGTKGVGVRAAPRGRPTRSCEANHGLTPRQWSGPQPDQRRTRLPGVPGTAPPPRDPVPWPGRPHGQGQTDGRCACSAPVHPAVRTRWTREPRPTSRERSRAGWGRTPPARRPPTRRRCALSPHTTPLRAHGTAAVRRAGAVGGGVPGTRQRSGRRFRSVPVLVPVGSGSAQVYLAEDGTRDGVTAGASVSGYQGSGHVEGFDQASDSVTITVPDSPGGLHTLSVRYDAPYRDKKANLPVNDAGVGEIALPATDSFTDAAAANVLLKAGANTVTVSNDWGWYLIDSAALAPAPPCPPHAVTGGPTDPPGHPETESPMRCLTANHGRGILSGRQDAAHERWLEVGIGKAPAREPARGGRRGPFSRNRRAAAHRPAPPFREGPPVRPPVRCCRSPAAAHPRSTRLNSHQKKSRVGFLDLPLAKRHGFGERSPILFDHRTSRVKEPTSCPQSMPWRDRHEEDGPLQRPEGSQERFPPLSPAPRSRFPRPPRPRRFPPAVPGQARDGGRPGAARGTGLRPPRRPGGPDEPAGHGPLRPGPGHGRPGQRHNGATARRRSGHGGRRRRPAVRLPRRHRSGRPAHPAGDRSPGCRRGPLRRPRRPPGPALPHRRRGAGRGHRRPGRQQERRDRRPHPGTACGPRCRSGPGREPGRPRRPR